MRTVWVRTAIVLAFLTLVARDRALLLWAVVAIVALLAGAPLLDHILRRLTVSQALSSADAFTGDTITVHLRVTNRSRLPLPWMRLREVCARRLQLAPPSWLVSLPPGETFEIQYPLPLPARGVYRIGRVEVEVGDWFGLWRRTGDVELPLWLTVFPRPVSPGFGETPPRRPDGERRQPTSPFRAWEPQGLREYRSGDPLRWIAWKASARHGQLVVRHFPPVRDPAHLVVLDLHPGRWPERQRELWHEQALSVAADWIVRRGVHDEPVGLLAHGSAARHEPPPPEAPSAPGDHRSRRPGHAVLPARRVAHLGREPLDVGPLRLEVRARRGAEHRRRLLAALAALEPQEDAAFARTVPVTAPRLASHASILWLAGRADPDVLAAARTLAVAGNAVWLLVAGQGLPQSDPAPGVRVWRLRLEEAEADAPNTKG